jgi:hypothetical protein
MGIGRPPGNRAGVQWVNDAGKWVNRIKANFGKTERVTAEIESAAKEGRIKTTPHNPRNKAGKSLRHESLADFASPAAGRYGRNKSADTLKCFASVRTCASVNCRSPRRIIPPNVR